MKHAQLTDVHTLSEASRALRERLLKSPYLVPMLEAFPTMAVVLNQDREIVLHNVRFAEAMPSGTHDRLLGLRLGEAVGCLNEKAAPGGCGTGEACSLCGAVLAMFEAQKGNRAIQECRILAEEDGQPAGAYDFRVLAVPLTIGDDDVTIFSLLDISSEKRRQVLERVFFHDVLNTAGGVKSLSELFHLVSQAEYDGLIEDLGGLSDQLIEEIQTQRDLIAAERDEISASLRPISTHDMLDHVHALYRFHSLAQGRFIEVENRAEGVVLTSDATLLARAIGNLVKNALEASAEGETITLHAARCDANTVEFGVHNRAVISRDVLLQMNQRSYSTKGVGRGIGMYSVRLIVERVLGGRVTVTSEEGRGTTVSVCLPIENDNDLQKTNEAS